MYCILESVIEVSDVELDLFMLNFYAYINKLGIDVNYGHEDVVVIRHIYSFFNQDQITQGSKRSRSTSIRNDIHRGVASCSGVVECTNAESDGRLLIYIKYCTRCRIESRVPATA